VNRLTISVLMTPAGVARNRGHGGGFFMFMYLSVAIGGALRSVGRFWLSGLVANRFGETFP
jgi:hypothetical protein